MKNIDLEALRAENKELIKKACIFANTTYALIEVADSLMVDVNSMLEKTGVCVNRNEIQKVKNIKRQGRIFRTWLKDFASQIYKIEASEEALNNADALYDLVVLILDRCGGKEEILSLIRAMIFNSFKSQYNYYDK